MELTLKKCFVPILLLVIIDKITEEKKTFRNFTPSKKCFFTSIMLSMIYLNSILIEFISITLKNTGNHRSPAGEDEKILIFYQLITSNFIFYVLLKINQNVYFEFIPVIK